MEKKKNPYVSKAKADAEKAFAKVKGDPKDDIKPSKEKATKDEASSFSLEMLEKLESDAKQKTFKARVEDEKRLEAFEKATKEEIKGKLGNRCDLLPPMFDTLERLELHAQQSSPSSSTLMRKQRRKPVGPPSALVKAQWQDEAFWHCMSLLYSKHPGQSLPDPLPYLQRRYALVRAQYLAFQAKQEETKLFGSNGSSMSNGGDKTKRYFKVRRRLLNKLFYTQADRVEKDCLQHLADAALKKALEAERSVREGTTPEDEARKLMRNKEWDLTRQYRTFTAKDFKDVTTCKFGYQRASPFALGDASGAVLICAPFGSSSFRFCDGHTNTVTGMDWDSSSKYLLTVSMDKTARLWNSETKKTRAVDASKSFVSISSDYQASAARQTAMKIIYGHGILRCCRFCPENNNFFVAAVECPQKSQKSEYFLRLFFLGFFSGSGDQISHDPTWEVSFDHAITALEFAGENELLVSDSNGSIFSIRVDLQMYTRKENKTKTSVKEIKCLGTPSIVFSCDQYNVDMSSDGLLQLIDSIPQVFVESMEYRHHNSQTLVFVDSYDRIRLLQRQSFFRTFQEEVFALGLKQHHVCASTCARSENIAAGSTDGNIYIYDPYVVDIDVQSQCVHVLEGHRNPIKAIAWNSDETALVSVDEGGGIIVWGIQGQNDKGSSFNFGSTCKDLVRQGVLHFNADPKKGMYSLQFEFGLVQSDAASQAKFLMETPGLSKKQIGKFLADPGNTEVLKAFTEMINFATMPFFEALKHFLAHFHLPGEAQQIERIVQAFAAAYFSTNPFVLKSTEECFVLGYSAIMLNTDKKSRKGKMTLLDFIQTVQSVPGGKGIERKVIERVFQDVKKIGIETKKGGEERRKVRGKIACPICGELVKHRNMMTHVEIFHGKEEAPMVVFD
eukprot:g1826.t1